VKEALRGKRFSSDECHWRGAKMVKDELPPPQKKTFFEGIKKLVKRWNWYVEVEGHYVEK
jgi:hypothetical protein